ncbi:MAG: S9 family peptidase [Nannocystaceae bacterium]
MSAFHFPHHPFSFSLAVTLLVTACAPSLADTAAEAAAPAPVALQSAVSAVDPVRLATPPLAEVRPHNVESPHGTRVDNYYWLRDDERKDLDMLAYLEAENAYKEQVLGHIKPLEEKIFSEIVGRIQHEDSTVPYRYRGYYYLTRFEEGKEYPIHARKKGSLDGAEERLLDVNLSADGHKYYSARGLQVSPDGRLLAFAEDTVGRRQYTVRIKDLATGQLLPDSLPGTAPSVAWADDNKTLFYVEKDPVTLLGVRVKKHTLGAPALQDFVVYEENDHGFYMSVGRTGDDKFIVIRLRSTISNELRYLPASGPSASFQVLAPRERDHEYDADHVGGKWVIRTNWQAKNFRLMTVQDGRAGDKSRWKSFVEHDAKVMISGFEAFDSYIVVAERSEGLRRIRVRSWDKKSEFFVDSDESAYRTAISVNEEQNTDWLRYTYTSLTTPSTVYEINMRSRERRLLKQDPVLGGFNPTDYTTKRIWATARDGTEIPVSIVHRKDVRKDGTAPIYQYAYGSYGSSTDPRFSSPLLSLLDRGFVYALAHVRGGQEMGRAWYDQGKMLNKKNTFTDFIDVTQFLTREGYGAKDKVVAAGGSAGGLLVGGSRKHATRALSSDGRSRTLCRCGHDHAR